MRQAPVIAKVIVAIVAVAATAAILASMYRGMMSEEPDLPRLAGPGSVGAGTAGSADGSGAEGGSNGDGMDDEEFDRTVSRLSRAMSRQGYATIRRLTERTVQRDRQRGVQLLTAAVPDWEVRDHWGKPERTLLEQLVTSWAEHDLDAAAAWAENLGNPAARQAALPAVASFRAARDLPAAIGWARTLSDDDRGLALYTIVSDVDLSDDSAWELLAELSGAPSKDLVVGAIVWKRIKQARYADAAVYIAEMSTDAARARAGTALAEAWAGRELNDARAWVEELPPGSLRQNAASVVARASAKTDPLGAVRWADALDDNAGRPEALGETLWQLDGGYAKRPALSIANLRPGADEPPDGGAASPFDNPTRTLDMASKMHGERSRYFIVFEMARQWAQRDGNAALAWADELEDEDLASAARAGVGYTLTFFDLDAALGIVDGLGEGPGREMVLAAAAWEMARMDGAAMDDWLSALPAGRSRDRAISAYANSLSAWEPAVALEWADSIETPTIRETCRELVLQQWRYDDPAAAAEYLDGAAQP